MRWGWIFTLPLTLVVVVFAVMNRESVHVELWPWPWDAEAPLFVLVGVAFLLGFAIGGLAVWVSGGANRRRMRELNRVGARNAQELKDLRSAAGTRGDRHADAPQITGPARQGSA
jgi:uncharacterized integral membrane protein